jgi:phage terminase large subunit GpA-like protein
MMVSRAAAFEDAKILRNSTPQISGTCRITRAYQRSDQREYQVPCPHCGHFAALTWENFRSSINPERLASAYFTCMVCGGVIDHSHKTAIVAAGKWVARNPRGDHPGFYIWRAYAPQRDWASIAQEYAQCMGWTGLSVTEATEADLRKQVEAQTEQVFWNDVLGLPFEQASKGPDWTVLRDRAENAEPGTLLPRSVLPATGMIVAAGVDCQGDRTEVQIVAFGRNYRRWVIEYVIIPYNIAEQACWDALDALLKATWRTETGLRLPIDMMAVDGGTYTEDVWSFAKRHPWSRVIIVKGAVSPNGPILLPMKFERRADGQAKRQQKRGFMVNVSQLKADFYNWLTKIDPLERGYCQFATGLGDEYFRQITSEVRVLKRSRTGVTTSQWDLVEASRRNEALDTMNYAEAAARRKGWTSMTDDQWDLVAAERGATPPQGGQPDLFDAVAVSVAATVPPGDVESAGNPAPAHEAPAPVAAPWIDTRDDWIR